MPRVVSPPPFGQRQSRDSRKSVFVYILSIFFSMRMRQSRDSSARIAVGLAVPPGREIDVNEIVKRVEEEEKGWKI